MLDGEPLFRVDAQMFRLRDLGVHRRSLGLQRCLKIIGTCSRQQQADEQTGYRDRPPKATEQDEACRPGHASFDEKGTPAIVFIFTAPPITGTPAGQRDAVRRDFAMRVTVTALPWFPPST